MESTEIALPIVIVELAPTKWTKYVTYVISDVLNVVGLEESVLNVNLDTKEI